MEFSDVEELRKFIPTQEDHQSVDVVKSFRVLPHFKPVDEYAEMLGKLCYIAKEKIELELRAYESISGERSWGAKLVMIDRLTVLTTLRVRMFLSHHGFLITEQESTTDGMMRFVGERMPEKDWDEERPLWEYPENVIVRMPLYYPQFINLYEKINRNGSAWGKWYKINWLITDFKIWMFAPLYYCIVCGKHHQGTHRLAVARELEMPIIKVRTIRHWWERRTTTPKNLGYYLEPEEEREQRGCELVPYKKYDKRLMEHKDATKPSKAYKDYLILKKEGKIR